MYQVHDMADAIQAIDSLYDQLMAERDEAVEEIKNLQLQLAEAEDHTTELQARIDELTA